MELIDGGKNGWKVGDFLVSMDCRHMGVVLRVHESGFTVLWDDQQVGVLSFDKDAPNSVNTVKQIAMYANRNLRDFLDTPFSDLWRAVQSHAYVDSYPRHNNGPLSTRDYLHAL